MKKFKKKNKKKADKIQLSKKQPIKGVIMKEGKNISGLI